MSTVLLRLIPISPLLIIMMLTVALWIALQSCLAETTVNNIDMANTTLVTGACICEKLADVL